MREAEVWSWGAGTHGQLGSGSWSDTLAPQRVPALCGLTITHMACGGAHAVAVLEGGEVGTWGRGQSGPLGHGDEASSSLPRPVKPLQGLRIQNVAAGWNHTAFVTESGELYTCGDGKFGQLGLDDFGVRLRPCLVEHLAFARVSMAACGMRHTLALVQGPSEAARVFAFGSSKRGQLGTPPWERSDSWTKGVGRVSRPQVISALDMQRIVTISANGDHSAALTGTGHLYIWGRGFNSSPNIFLPSAAASGLQLRQISLGWSHGLALSEEQQVWAWGSNRCGQLGSQDSDCYLPSDPQTESSLWRASQTSTTRHEDSGNSHVISTHSLFGRTCEEASKDAENQSEMVASSTSYALEKSRGGSHFPVANAESGHICNMKSNEHALLEASLSCRALAVGKDEGKGELRRDVGVQLISKVSLPGLRKVGSLGCRRALWVSAGAEHSTAVLEDGTVMVWGWAEHGQLGLGTTDDQNLPQHVPIEDHSFLSEVSVSGDTGSSNHKLQPRVFCGSGFTFVIKE